MQHMKCPHLPLAIGGELNELGSFPYAAPGFSDEKQRPLNAMSIPLLLYTVMAAPTKLLAILFFSVRPAVSAPNDGKYPTILPLPLPSKHPFSNTT